MSNKERRAKWRDWIIKMAAGKVTDAEAEKLAEAAEKSEMDPPKTKDEETPAGGPSIHFHAGEGGEGKFADADEFAEHVEKNNKEHAEMRDSIAALTEKVNALAPAEKKEESTETGDNAEIEGELEEEAPEGTKDAARKARDSAYLEESFTQTLAGAEILVPGIRPTMTFDKAASPVTTYRDGICGLRRTALDGFYQTSEGRAFIDQQLMGKAFDVKDTKTMPCRRVADLFSGAVAMKRTLNNMRAGGAPGAIPAGSARGTMNGPFGTEVVSASQLAAQAASAWNQDTKH